VPHDVDRAHDVRRASELMMFIRERV